MCVGGGLCDCVSTAQGAECDPPAALMLSGNVKPDLLQERHVKINTQWPPQLSAALPFTILSFSSHPSICPSPLSFLVSALIFLFLPLPLSPSTRLPSAPLAASHSHIYLSDHLFLTFYFYITHPYFLPPILQSLSPSLSTSPAPPSLWHIMYNLGRSLFFMRPTSVSCQ